MAILNHTSTSVETGPKKPRDKAVKPPMEQSRLMSAPKWNRRDTVLLLLVLLLAGGLRILRLAEPNVVVFDETYYAKDACLYLGHTQQFCGLDQATEQSYVHPPLGKWLISLGISAFGYNSFGWRFSAAVFGTAMAGLVFILARRLFRDRWTGAVAGLLTAVDLLLIAQSRIAMLDIFLAFFVVLGFWFIVVDRERTLAFKDHLASRAPESVSGRAAASDAPFHPLLLTGAPKASSELAGDPAGKGEGPGPPEGGGSTVDGSADSKPLSRGVRWRLLAGAAFGLALAVKWSALLALAAAGLCALFWSMELLLTARKHGSSSFGGRPAVSFGRELAVSFGAFFLVPALVYGGSYAAYFVDRYSQDCPFTVPGGRERLFDSSLLNQPEGKCYTGIAGTALSFVDLQDRVFDYHANLDAKHSYQSKAWTWPLLLRPVAYHYDSANGKATEVMALGNVATWYAALIALAWLIPRSLKKWRPERVVLLAWGAQYLPWLLVPRPLFLFYMTPAVPFMMIGLAAGLAALRRRAAWGRKLALTYLVLAAGVFVILFYPVIAAVPLPQEWWQRLMWIPHFDCGGFMCGWI